MKGLRIDSPNPRKFTKVFDSVMHEFERHYWLIDTQSGPFSTTDKPNFRELDADIKRYYVSVPEFEDSLVGLWRPGILRFADLLMIDEFTTLVGILGSESEAAASAAAISSRMGISLHFFELIQERADFALLHIDGWWEIYSTNLNLMNRLGQIEGASATESALLCRQLYPE